MDMLLQFRHGLLTCEEANVGVACEYFVIVNFSFQLQGLDPSPHFPSEVMLVDQHTYSHQATADLVELCCFLIKIIVVVPAPRPAQSVAEVLRCFHEVFVSPTFAAY